MIIVEAFSDFVSLSPWAPMTPRILKEDYHESQVQEELHYDLFLG